MIRREQAAPRHHIGSSPLVWVAVPAITLATASSACILAVGKFSYSALALAAIILALACVHAFQAVGRWRTTLRKTQVAAESELERERSERKGLMTRAA